MAGHPLRSATDRRLGRPLPHQLPNQTRVHPSAINLWYFDHAVKIHYAVLPFVSKRYPPLKGRLLTRYSPVRHSVISYFIRRIRNQASFDLHVLSTPPAFVLSQDQTLHDIWKSVWLLFIDWYYSLFDVLYNRTSHVGVHSVHCSVFKGHRHHRLSRRLVYFNKLRRACQGCF